MVDAAAKNLTDFGRAATMTDTQPAEPTPTPEEPRVHGIPQAQAGAQLARIPDPSLASITLGVGIALAAEQAIEWLHWRGEVRDARQAIHAEIAADEANPIARHLAFQPCLDRQLREAEAILANLEAHRPPGRFTSFHSGFGGPGVTAEWDAQRAAQTLAQLPPEEVASHGPLL